jgi:hypothetical protein
MTLQLPSGEHFYSAHLLIYQTCPVRSSFILNFSFGFSRDRLALFVILRRLFENTRPPGAVQGLPQNFRQNCVVCHRPGFLLARIIAGI